MDEQMSIPELGRKQREDRRASQEGKSPTFKLMIATPLYMQQEFGHYGDSLIETVRMLEQVGVPWEKQTLNGDSYIDRAKNSIVANFLESDCTDLLMIDSDLRWSPDAVGRMMQNQQEVIAAFFPMKNAWGTFAGALMPDADGNIPEVSSAIELADGSCLLKAYLLPGGFLRIKRSLLERFADHYDDMVYQDPCADPSKTERVYTAFFECERHDYIRCGEDATFCRRVRDMGVNLWVDPNITLHHYGIKGWEGNFHQHLMKSPEEIDAIIKERESLAESVKSIKVDQEIESCVS